MTTARALLEAMKRQPAKAMAAVSALSEDEQAELQEHLEAELRQQQRTNILAYARAIEVPGAPSPSETASVEDEQFYPQLLEPPLHMDLILATAQDLIDDKLKGPRGEPVDGMIVTISPGSGKSTVISQILPSFLMGYKPRTNIIAASYAQELSDRFSRRVRSIVGSPAYSRIFPEASLVDGNTAVRAWACGNGSEYRSAGVGAGIAGFRCNLLICDDLLANREEAESPVIRDKVWAAINDDLLPRAKGDWFRCCFVNTRWQEDDHIGRLLGETYKGQSGFWTGTNGMNFWIINLPLIAEHADDPMGRNIGEVMWPENYKPRTVERLRNDRTPSGMRLFSSLYQQRPAPAEGAVILREYWQPWGKLVERNGKWVNDKAPPDVSMLVMSYDTAFEEGEEADFSAATLWGVFEHRVSIGGGRRADHNHAILLGAWRDKVSAADLLRKVEEHYKQYSPDLILIEKRASGIQLIQELKRKRLPVRAWLPRGKPGMLGKLPRLHGISTIFEAGCVHYYPVHHGQAATTPQTVIDEVSMAPNGKYWDLTDTVTSCLDYLRRANLINVPSDAPTEQEEFDEAERDATARNQPRRLYGGGNVVRRDEDDAPDAAGTGRRLYGGRR